MLSCRAVDEPPGPFTGDLDIDDDRRVQADAGALSADDVIVCAPQPPQGGSQASGGPLVSDDAFWAAARKALGDSAGTRALIEVLLLHRHLEPVDVLAGITAALTVGSVSADVVAVEARKTAQHRGIQPPPIAATPHQQQVVSLTARRLAELPGDERPLPSVSAYDDLLGKASS
jgi:hypothetical protein